MGLKTYWVIERTSDKKFPYRLRINQANELLLSLRIQDRWPGSGRNIFCLREESRTDWPEVIEELEHVPVISLNRYGKRIAVVLDRSRNKRCEFLFLKRKYKNKQGEYEQIFWRTQKALRQRRPKVKLTVSEKASFHVIIDTNERYPWIFRGCTKERTKLPVGDYAIKDGDRILAVVERKTFENMLAEFGNMPLSHQSLGELEAYPQHALVIEAGYTDFLNPEKVKPYKPSFTSKAIAEIFALHPKLRVVFCENRKSANQWCHHFFSTVLSHMEDKAPDKVAETVARYEASSFTR